MPYSGFHDIYFRLNLVLLPTVLEPIETKTDSVMNVAVFMIRYFSVPEKKSGSIFWRPRVIELILCINCIGGP